MSRNSEYFWVKDLQREAERLGWKPRGAKAAEKAAEKAAKEEERQNAILAGGKRKRDAAPDEGF